MDIEVKLSHSKLNEFILKHSLQSPTKDHLETMWWQDLTVGGDNVIHTKTLVFRENFKFMS